MPTSSIDTILQISPPARAPESPSRSSHSRRDFGPALEKAYASERTRETPPPTAVDDEPLEAAADESINAENSSGERAETSGEQSEVDANVEQASGQADDEGGADEKAEDDEVEVSELASAAVAAEEAQAAVKSDELAVAVQGEQGEQVQTAEGAKAAGEQQQPEENSNPGSDKRRDLLATMGEGAGDGQSLKNEATRAGKQAGGGIEAAVADAAEKKVIADQDVEGASHSAAGQQPTAKSTESTGKAPAEGETASTKLEDGGKPQQSAVEQKAELAAAIDRQVKLPESSGASDATTADATPAASTDSVSANTATQRSTATLDRLAAAALRRGDEATQADGGPQIDRPRFVQRVEGALRAAQQRDGRVQVRLAPPELGVVHIELAVQNGVMTAKLEAETATARNALLDNLPALRDRLAEQNIRVEKFDVDVRRDPQQGGSNNAPNDRPDGHGEPNSQARRGRTATPLTNATTPRTARQPEAASTAGLDIRI